jgi:hypothetical protein
MLTDMKGCTDTKLSVHLSGGVFKGKCRQTAVVPARAKMFPTHSDSYYRVVISASLSLQEAELRVG